MDNNVEQNVINQIDILISYRNGYLNLDEAVFAFCSVTGLDETIARKMIPALKRKNLISFGVR